MEALKTYLKEIRNIPLLKPEEEISLSRKIKRGNELARKKMIRSNLRLVINIAKKYMYLGIPLLDLIEEGNIGLMKAVDRFNPNKGFRFSTYAAWWIKQSIIRSIIEQGKMIRIPVYMNELITKWKKTQEQLAHKLKRPASNDEIAKRLRLTQDKVDQINFWLSTSTSSLDAPIGDEGESQVSDLLVDKTTEAPDAGIVRMFDKERIKNLMNIMIERERKVLDLRFGLATGKPQTLAEISKKMGISRERVRQIEEEAILKVRRFIKDQEQEL